MSNDLLHILRDKAVRDEIIGSAEEDAKQDNQDVELPDIDTLSKEIEGLSSGRESTPTFGTEAIIRRKGRPVLFIQDQMIQQEELDRKLTLGIWRQRFTDSMPNILSRIPSVGRVEISGHPRYSWAGTGWMVAPRVMVTNRHVAEVFAHQTADGFDFRLDPRKRPIRCSLDTFEEHERFTETDFRVQKVLHIEEEPGPDMAFLYMSPRDSIDDVDLPPVIPLSANEPVDGQVVGAIGYAAWDGIRNEKDVMREIFEGIYEVKRIHPGEVMGISDDGFTHDCSTLGGNSGSVVVDFETGDAVGLHFAGQFEQRNYAVKASDILAALRKLGLENTAVTT